MNTNHSTKKWVQKYKIYPIFFIQNICYRTENCLAVLVLFWYFFMKHYSLSWHFGFFVWPIYWYFTTCKKNLNKFSIKLFCFIFLSFDILRLTRKWYLSSSPAAESRPTITTDNASCSNYVPAFSLECPQYYNGGNPRSNNVCEGWNNKFHTLVGSSHPSIWTVIKWFQREQSTVTTIVQQDNESVTEINASSEENPESMSWPSVQ